MPYQPRSYPLVPIPQGPDPLQSLAGIMSFTNDWQQAKAAQDEDIYRKKERARIDENRSVLQSAQSSRLPPAQVEAQLMELGRGDLVPVFKETWSALETSRLGLKKLKDEEQQRQADYLGALASGIKRANFEPMAIEWAFQEAERDGHDVTELRQLFTDRPELLPTVVDDLIDKSPRQREWFATETDRALSQTREDRALQAAKDLAEDRRIDNERQAEAERRQRAAQQSTDAHQRAMERLAAQAASRERGPLTASDRARIEQTYADGLNDLDTRRKGRVNPRYPDEPPSGALSDAEYATQKRRLDEAYRKSLRDVASTKTVVAPPDTEVTRAELAALAQQRGTTLEQEQARAEAAGYTVH